MGKSRSSVRPLPIENLRHVLSVLGDVLPVTNELVAEKLFGVGSDELKLWDAIDDLFVRGVPTDILAKLMIQTHIQSPQSSL